MFGDDFFKVSSILNIDQSIVENSQTLMNPNSNQVLFTVTVESVYLIKSLNDFGHVSQIEHVVAFCRNWKEYFWDSFVNINGGNSKWFRKRFDFFVKLREFMGKNWLENSLKLFVIWEGEVETEELRLQSLTDFCATTSWRSHGTHELNIQNVFEKFLLLGVEPALIVHPLSDQFYGRLSSKGVLSRHVKIINEKHSSFSTWHHFHEFNYYFCF